MKRTRSRQPLSFGAIAIVLAALAFAFVAWAKSEPARFLDERERAWGIRIQPGDVLFQDHLCGPRCDLIREMTQSHYVHTGIVAEEGGRRVVWEAFHPVGPTPLDEWIYRGRDHKVAVYRLSPTLEKRWPAIETALHAMRGLPYDGDFQWDDRALYCSELVAKAVQRGTGVTLAEPHAMGKGAFGGRAAQISRMTHGRLTEETLLVSPKDLAHSPLLTRLVDELADPG